MQAGQQHQPQLQQHAGPAHHQLGNPDLQKGIVDQLNGMIAMSLVLNAVNPTLMNVGTVLITDKTTTIALDVMYLAYTLVLLY